MRRGRFIWDGMRLRGKDSPGKATDVLYVYNGDSYEPLARVDRFTRQVIEPQDTRPPKTTVYYYHTALNGLPEAMTSESGQLVYEARYGLWGKETEAASAHITRPDPIGLRGGLNLYAYAPNPLSYSDPLGLCPKTDFKWGNPKSKPTYGHTFSEHGQKMKPSQLIDRARNKDHQVKKKIDLGL